MTDTVENTQRTMIPGMGEEGEKLTVAQNPAARAGGRERDQVRMPGSGCLVMAG